MVVMRILLWFFARSFPLLSDFCISPGKAGLHSPIFQFYPFFFLIFPDENARFNKRSIFDYHKINKRNGKKKDCISSKPFRLVPKEKENRNGECIGCCVGSAVFGWVVGFYPVESAITAGLCMANMGGAGDLAVLGAAKRMDLMVYAQISSRIGGAMVLLIASILFAFL